MRGFLEDFGSITDRKCHFWCPAVSFFVLSRFLCVAEFLFICGSSRDKKVGSAQTVLFAEHRANLRSPNRAGDHRRKYFEKSDFGAPVNSMGVGDLEHFGFCTIKINLFPTVHFHMDSSLKNKDFFGQNVKMDGSPFFGFSF